MNTINANVLDSEWTLSINRSINQSVSQSFIISKRIRMHYQARTF